MKHEQWLEQLSAIRDGECGVEEKARVEAHLVECLSCREAAREWESAIPAIRWMGAVKPSGAFVTRVMARVDASSRASRGWRSALSWLVPVAGLAAAAWFLVASIELHPPVISASDLIEAETSSDIILSSFDI